MHTHLATSYITCDPLQMPEDRHTASLNSLQIQNGDTITIRQLAGAAARAPPLQTNGSQAMVQPAAALLSAARQLSSASPAAAAARAQQQEAAAPIAALGPNQGQQQRGWAAPPGEVSLHQLITPLLDDWDLFCMSCHVRRTATVIWDGISVCGRLVKKQAQWLLCTMVISNKVPSAVCGVLSHTLLTRQASLGKDAESKWLGWLLDPSAQGTHQDVRMSCLQRHVCSCVQ